MVNLCLGIEQPENPFLPQRNQFFFGLYTVAAVFYRWIVVFSILMFLEQGAGAVRVEDRRAHDRRDGFLRPGRSAGMAVGQVLLHAGEDA